MNFLKGIFSKKDKSIETYNDFWNWFQNNAKTFYSLVKQHKNIEKDFFDPLSSKLNQLKDGFFFLTGMFDDSTAELVLTPDGNIKNIVFVEELVKSAPIIDGWRFTALKPALGIENSNIEMAGYRFNKENLSFYSNDNYEYPDEIDITIVHNDFNEKDKANLISGTYIFLDNYLGELNSVTSIDSLKIIGKEEANKELIPIEKLNDFLIWRQKEFIEKYEGVLQNTENANFSILEANLKNGNKLIATINADILNWDKKASHPWIASLEIKFGGSENNGMPDNDTYQALNTIDDEILKELKDSEGYLNIGRQTANGIRVVYYACKDFRKPSKVLYSITEKYNDKYELSYDIYKDKYWRSFNRFRQN
jgi:hypothetical protein